MQLNTENISNYAAKLEPLVNILQGVTFLEVLKQISAIIKVFGHHNRNAGAEFKAIVYYLIALEWTIARGPIYNSLLGTEVRSNYSAKLTHLVNVLQEVENDYFEILKEISALIKVVGHHNWNAEAELKAIFDGMARVAPEP